MGKLSWINLGLAAVCGAGFALFAGCSSNHSGVTPADQPGAPNFIAVDQRNEDRLTPVAGGAPSALGISGTITVQGLNVLTDQAQPVPAGQANTHITAQLIDEEDDILSEMVPGADGKYALTVFSPTLTVRLRVTVKVADDLNGDGIGNDTLTQEVPVQLVTGKSVSVSLRLKRAVQADMQPVLWPTAGAVVLCDLSRTDGNGSLTKFYGTFIAGGFVIISLDGDRLLEDGDDWRQPDANHDGWADPGEAVYGNPTLSTATLSGTVKSVDTIGQTLIVSRQGVNTVVFLGQFCSIEPFSAMAGFFGEVPLTPSLTGRVVTVQGQLGPGGMMADWVVYTP